MFSVANSQPGALTSALAAHRSGANPQNTGVHSQTTPATGFGSFLAKANELKLSSGKPIKVAPAGFRPDQFRVPSNYLSTSATELVRAVRQLLASSTPASNEKPVSASYQSLYAIAEAQVSAANSNQSVEALYDRIKIELERAAGELASNLRSAGSSEPSRVSDISWLNQLERSWTSWRERVSLLQSILLPIDRYLVANLSHLLPFIDLSIDIFGHRILNDSEISRIATSRIIDAVNAERQEQVKYRQLHTTLVAMFNQLNAYAALETALHAATAAFYAAESESSLSALSVCDYLSYAQSRIVQETERNEWLFSTPSGRDQNVKAARNELVAQRADSLLGGLSDLIDQEQIAPLGTLFVLVQSVDGLTMLRDQFGAYIRKAGEAIVNDRERDDQMIDRLLEYKAKMDRIVSESFQRETTFSNAQKDSFEVFVNKRENKPAELIAKFLDAKLKSGNKTMTDEELEHCLNEALVLFRYTHDKDMFEEFYKRYFAKRLLLNRSASSDAEKSMLLKLKEECGPGFTAKLETMIKDVELSKDLMHEYSQARAKAAKDGDQPDPFDLGVSVLTQAHWPTYPPIDVILPTDMASSAERFVSFYQGRNSGRKLHWQHSLGTLSIVAQFPKAGVKELQVSTFQAIVLLLFNSGEKLGYRDIRAQTGLEDKELKRTLQSLACGQIPTRVLRKMPQGRDVSDDDEFVVNDKFKNERHRIRINQIQMKETDEEQKSTEQRVFLDRELILQAAAVRVLKARKTIKHSELLTEVVDQIKSRFAVDVSEIKKTFEILIEKEYMERVEGERGVYRYLA